MGDKPELDFASMSISQLLELQNEMVLTAIDFGLEGSAVNPRKSFKNRADALASCGRLHQAIVEAKAGNLEAARGVIGAPARSLPHVADPVGEGETLAAVGKTDAPAVSPGLQRLRDSKGADALRAQNVADANKALKQIADERTGAGKSRNKVESKVEKTAKKAVTKAAKAPKAPKAEKAPKAARAPKAEKAARTNARTSVNQDGKIRRLVPENPKREGTAAFAVFALYKDGMKVSTLIDKVVEKEIGSRGLALENLRWDVAKGFIAIEDA